MAMEFGKLNFAVGFNRTSAFPLDANSYFESYAEALAAVRGAAEVGSSDSAYYLGQLIIVNDKTEAADKGIALYQITGVVGNATLTKFGQATSADELGERITALQNSISTINGKLILADETHDGFMSKGDFAKLKGVAEGAQVNVIEGVKVDGVDLEVADKKVNIDLSGYVKKDGDKVLSDNNYDDASKAIVDGIEAKVAAEADRASKAEKANADAIAGLGTRLTTAEGTIETHGTDIADLKTKIVGLTGAMHFVGTSTTDPTLAAGATIEGKDAFASGDVCLFGKKEYVYDGAKWVELGDEGSHLTKTEAAETYATKTQVAADIGSAKTELTAAIGTAKNEAIETAGTNADTKIAEALKDYTTTEALNAELAKKLEAKDLADYAKTADVDTKLGKKVDKVEGKSLVSDALITKLESIQDNAVIKSVGAGLALSAEKELSVDAETIPAIAIAKVTGLQAALDTKQTAEQVSAAIASAKIKSNQIEGTVASAATADKVANALTVGGKVYNGSEAVEVTAADLGALTEIPQATEAALGGIKIGHAAGANEAALKLDEEGKAYVDIPAAVVYSAKENGGLEMDSNHAFSIKEVSTDLLKQGTKTLVLDGGTAAE